jgi:hypothetical protein
MKLERKHITGIVIIVVVVVALRPQLFESAFTGGWEVTLSPDKVTENNLGITRDLNMFTRAIDFDEQFYGAPDIRFQKSDWYHTNGIVDAFTNRYQLTDKSEPFDTFEVTDAVVRATSDDGELLFTKNEAGELIPAYETTKLAYDLHLFYMEFQVSTDGDSRVVDTPRIGSYNFEHETSATDYTKDSHRDLGTPMDISIRLKASVNQWAVRVVPGVETSQQFGIMKIYIAPGKYTSSEVVNLAEKKAEYPGDEEFDRWDDEKRGSGRKDGYPQSGGVDMWWVNKPTTPYNPTSVTSTSYGVPDVLPEEVYFDLHAEFRLRYIYGWHEGNIIDDVVNLLPVDAWVEWGIIMEVITVSGYWIYTDPFANEIEDLYTDQNIEYEPPGLFDGLLGFIKDFDLFGFGGITAGIIGIGVLVLVVIILSSILKRTPQMQVLKRIRRQI